MTDYRIKTHPILPIKPVPYLSFYWNNQECFAKTDEMISSALFANGIHTFGHHPKDNSPQGLFCANGQCSQCMVIADGLPVKACMTAVKPGMRVFPTEGLPVLPDIPLEPIHTAPTLRISVEALIIGGGPAGLSAAQELGKAGLSVLLVDDKDKLGGKLVLQTHRFFGSSEAVFAGTRGIDIAKKLEAQARAYPDVEIWENSTALAIFEDHSVGVLRAGSQYVLVQPRVLLVAAGARERSLAFPGNTLPGVYGAGAFQTLVNRDLVRPCENLFIVGGGNVGLIAGYHAIQAGIHVAGLVEAAPACGGYRVHLDKLVRSGVPVFTSHTVLEAAGEERVEKIRIAQVDANFHPIPSTAREFACDTILIAVGLDPVNEFIRKAEEVGLPVFSAGDAQEIAEASAAIFSGRIAGAHIADWLGKSLAPIPDEWVRLEGILKSKPGALREEDLPVEHAGVFPVLHCNQEIPCDPCTTICPKHLIRIDAQDIRKLPQFLRGEAEECIGCLRCVSICPGLAITLVDFRKRAGTALVSLPYEQEAAALRPGSLIMVTDTSGTALTSLPVHSIRKLAGFSGTHIISVEAPADLAPRIAGLRLIPTSEALEGFHQSDDFPAETADEAYVCRCERVTAGEIRQLIRSGIRDINQIKAVLRVSMGACGGKTCLNMVKRMYQQEGIPLSEVSEPPIRPVFVEMPVSLLANVSRNSDGGAQ